MIRKPPIRVRFISKHYGRLRTRALAIALTLERFFGERALRIMSVLDKTCMEECSGRVTNLKARRWTEFQTKRIVKRFPNITILHAEVALPSAMLLCEAYASKLRVLIMRGDGGGRSFLLGPTGTREVSKFLRHNCPKLEILDLAVQSMGPKGMEVLGEALPYCPRLTSLNLSRNKLGKEGIRHVANAIPEMYRLLRLDLDGNGVDMMCMKFIAASLPACRRLQVLNLSDAYYRKEGAETLATTLGRCKSITKLDLSRSYMGSAGLAAITDVLPQIPALKELVLNEMDKVFGVDVGRAVRTCYALERLSLSRSNFSADDIAHVFEYANSQNLAHLDISHNALTFVSASRMFAEKFPPWPKLRSLRVGHNPLHPEGVDKLCRIIPAHAWAIEYLDLSAVHAEEKGARTLGAVLPFLKNIRRLDFGTNNIGPRGTVALAEGLYEAKTLEHLDLSFNHIDTDSAIKLCDSLNNCRRLTHVDLSVNEIGELGTKKFALVMPSLPLRYLSLRSNAAHGAGLLAVAAILPRCPLLKELRMDANDFEGEALSRFANFLNKNPTITQQGLRITIGS